MLMDDKTIMRFYGDACDVLDTLAELEQEHKERCLGPNDKLKAIKDAAKDAGIPRKTFNGLLQTRALEGKKAALTEKMDADEEEMFRFALEVVQGSSQVVISGLTGELAKLNGEFAMAD